MGRSKAVYVHREYGEGPPPTIIGQIVLADVNGVTIEGLNVTERNGAAVTLIDGATNVTIRNNELSQSAAGIQIINGDVDQIRIVGNTIDHNASSGIVVEDASPAALFGAVIAGNIIHSNGMHGVQLYANRWVIEGNEIHNNGLVGVPGTVAYT